MMVADLRTPIAANEGYLKYQTFSIGGGAALYGHERTGETRTTSPSDPAVTNTALGYDWSSVHVDFRTITVQHADGKTGKQRPGIETDFEFANQIFAGVGITAQHVDPAGVRNYTNPPIPNPIRDRETAKNVTKEFRADAGSNQINVYYVDEIRLGKPPPGQLLPPAMAGLTFQPSDFDVQAGVSDGILIAAGAVKTHADTFAHETVHYLFGSKANPQGGLETDDRIYRHVNPFDDNLVVDPNDPDAGEARDQGQHAPNAYFGQNLMNRMKFDSMGRPAEREPHSNVVDYPKKSLENTAPSDPLLNPYSRDQFSNLRRDQLNGQVYFDDDGTGRRNDPNEADEVLIPQIQGLYESKYVKGEGTVFADYAAVADLKWVEDSWNLENQGKADVTPRANGSRDTLRFTVPEAGALAAPTNALGLGNYTGGWFNVVDVLSNIARYSDNDVTTDDGNWSPEQAARDYLIQFSTTGLAGSWVDGQFVESFIDGWKADSTAEDWVIRWAAPGDMQAKFIQIIAIQPGVNGHDGNTQIDAIIAGVDANLLVSNFQIDLNDTARKSFVVNYVINTVPVEEVTLRVYSSPDGVQRGVILKEVTFTDTAHTSVGGHQWMFQNIVPPAGDHYLIAVIDPDDEIQEYDEGDNQIQFAGGTFYSPTTKRLYTQDSDHNGTDFRAAVELTLRQFSDGIAVPQYPLSSEFFSVVGLANVVGLNLYAHGGDDTVSFIGPLTWNMPLVWYAGPGNETFNGTALADEFHGGAGNDTAYGLAGADLLFGDAGDDLLKGGDGADILEGGNGFDRLYGDDGATTIRVGVESTDSTFDDVYAEWGAGDSTAIDWQGGRSGITAILSDRTLKVLGAGTGRMDLVQNAGGWSARRSGSGRLDLHAMYAGQAVPLTLEAGTTRLLANLKTTGYPLQSITATGGSRLEVHTAQNLNELHVVSGSGLVMTDHGSNALVVNLLEVNTASGSYIDVRNNDLIVQNGAQKAYVRSLFIAGHNGIDASSLSRWNGPGIRSSWVRERNVVQGWDLYSLGGIKNGDLAAINGPAAMYTTFTGQAVDANSILVKTTYSGDANLDGLVSMDDYGYADSAFYGMLDPAVYGWLAGDFDHDGDVDFQDYTLIDNAYYFQLGQM